jgi:cell division protein ZipA
MQELRFVLIIVGAIAIAALLFHGLWTSKKERKAKFAHKPMSKLDSDNVEGNSPQRAFAPEDDFEIIKKERKEPEFVEKEPVSMAMDPLFEGYNEDRNDDNPFLSEAIDSSQSESVVIEKVEPDLPVREMESSPLDSSEVSSSSVEKDDDSFEVIVLNVHCVGEEPFLGTKLFDSMQQNGLVYGEMDIFHRHADLSGTGKVLFSVANMMQPGTLAHNDPADFTTKGISFFMTMPCFGDAEQNFKLMLKTAQQIADDLGANVLDDARNLMTPNRLDSYRAQIQEFKAAQ